MSRESMLRSNLLACLATLDSFLSTWLCLFSIKGNLWQSLFPPGWPGRAALPVSVGDVALLIGVRWGLCTAAGAGGGYMLSPSGLFLTAGIHTCSTVFLAAKIIGAIDLLEADGPADELNRNSEAAPAPIVVPRTLMAAEAFGIAAAWVEFLLTLGSLPLLRDQLLDDNPSTAAPGLPWSGGRRRQRPPAILQASDSQPLLLLGPDGSPLSGRPSLEGDEDFLPHRQQRLLPVQQPQQQHQQQQRFSRAAAAAEGEGSHGYCPPEWGLPSPSSAAGAGDDGRRGGTGSEEEEEEEEFHDARSDCSFHSLASSGASYATAATHVTHFSSASSSMPSSPFGLPGGSGSARSGGILRPPSAKR